MAGKQVIDFEHFFITGINYKKTDASIRGQFAIQSEQYQSLLTKAKSAGIPEVFVLSTCNRTEIYGVAKDAEDLANLLCSETVGSIDTFNELSYTKTGLEAIEHFFSVGAGLDSQILGDYEIVGQIKQAIKFSKEHDGIGTFIERISNSVLQSSKAIKNQTELSGGTVSVAFAAIQFLRDNVTDIANKKILLVGTGKIGCNTCKNLVDYLGATNITLMNRTAEKAVALANELNVYTAPYENLYKEVNEADIIIVSTNAEEPIIKKTDLIHCGNKILIDLSIPNNIEAYANELPNIVLINVDGLSKINDATLQKRLEEVPKAKEIIVQHIDEFIDWCNMRKNVPVLKAVKQKLIDMHHCGLFTATYTEAATSDINPDAIQKVVNNMAAKLRQQNNRGCHYIEAINDYMAVGNNSQL
jgi:glutamyl-tRNA reductase